MKKLLVLGMLFLVSLSSNAQDTIFRGENPSYVNTSIKKEIFPAAKWGIFLDPLATLGSGIAVGVDYFSGRVQFRLLGAYHTASKPWFYEQELFGYSSFELNDFSGYRIEGQIRKDLTEDKSESSRFGAGIFANYRSVSVSGSNAYIFNTNPGSSTIGRNVTLNGKVFTFGPIFTFSEHSKLWYVDMHLGPGMIIDAGGENNKEIGIELVNPYKPGVMIKFGFVIGLNMM